jgi:hypothetical protein
MNSSSLLDDAYEGEFDYEQQQDDDDDDNNWGSETSTAGAAASTAVAASASDGTSNKNWSASEHIKMLKAILSENRLESSVKPLCRNHIQNRILYYQRRGLNIFPRLK